MPAVIVETDGYVVTATLAMAERRNALSETVIAEIIAALDHAESLPARAFVIRAEPDAGTWSAGHDISELPRDGSDPLTWTNPVEVLLRRVRATTFPVIAAVEGGAWGAACDLALTCDLLIATRSASFAISPTKLGIPYNTAGVAHFVEALPLNLAREMFFTAEPVSAERLAGVGVVNRLVDDTAELDGAIRGLTSLITSRAPLAIRAIKAEINALTDAQPMNSNTFEHLTANRRAAWRSADYQEGLRSFDERRSPNFTGK